MDTTPTQLITNALTDGLGWFFRRLALGFVLILVTWGGVRVFEASQETVRVEMRLENLIKQLRIISGEKV
jgi:hypothetical protein